MKKRALDMTGTHEGPGVAEGIGKRQREDERTWEAVHEKPACGGLA